MTCKIYKIILILYKFWFKKVQKKLKIVQQITRRKELFVQWIPKFFKGF